MTLTELKRTILDNSWAGQATCTDHDLADMTGFSRCHVCKVRRGLGITCLPKAHDPKPNYSIHRYDVEISFDYLAWLNRERGAYREAMGGEPDGPALKRWIDTRGCKTMEARA